MCNALGLPRKSVRLVPYDERWPELFRQEAALLRQHVGSELCEIVHIGSTAVPGIEAKPILDLMGAIPTLRASSSFFVRLGELGYEHRPLDPLQDRLFFAKDMDGNRTHNLSVCEVGSAFWFAHIEFRDRLRANFVTAQAYVQLKRALAEQYPNDRLAYTDAKDHFIAAVLRA